MLTPAEINRLDRIEQKIDRLLNLMGAGQVSNSRVEDMKAVLATGGVEALKKYAQNVPLEGARKTGDNK